MMEKPYYTTGEAAELIGVSPDTLRYWDRAGALSPSRRVGRRRYYTPEDVRKGVRIRELLEEGFSLRGAAQRVEGELGFQRRLAKEIKGIIRLIDRALGEG